MLRNDYIFITKQGLIEFEKLIEYRHWNIFRNRKVATADQILRSQNKRIDPFEKEIIRKIIDADELEGYDDEVPLSIQSETLKNYVDDLSKLQSESSSTGEK